MHITCTTCIKPCSKLFSNVYESMVEVSYLSNSGDLEISQSQINYLLKLNKYTIIIKHYISSSTEQNDNE